MLDLSKVLAKELGLKEQKPIGNLEAKQREQGITESFAKTAVLEAVESRYRNPPFHHEYEIGDLGDQGFVLRFVRNYSIYEVLASSHDRNWVETLQADHVKLRSRILQSTEGDSIIAAYTEIQKMGEALKKEFERISHYVTFTGKCSLYSPDD